MADAPAAEEDLNVDKTDPDYIAEHPPPAKAPDPKQFFQVGDHEGKWAEYDERGVPTKNMKKKKTSKKEKEALEVEYLDATKAYQKYLKSVEQWEQSKLDAEKALKGTDRLRWAFRQIGEKHDPIEADDMEQIVKLMGWKTLTPKELTVVKKGLSEIFNADGHIELPALRLYVKESMPMQLLEVRLNADSLDAFKVDDVYSPRTWRNKVEADPPQTRKLRTSPRGSGRKSTKKKTPKADDVDSPSASPRLSARKSTKKKATGGSSARGK